MRNLDDDGKAKKAASLVFHKIKDDRISPTPVAYAVLYAYYTNSNIDLCRAIDKAISGGGPLTQEVYSTLFMRHIAPEIVDDLSKNDRNHLKNLLVMISNVLGEAKDEVQIFGGVLENAEVAIRANVETNTVEHGGGAVIADMHTHILQLIESNIDLQGNLGKALNEIGEMKCSFDRVVQEANTDGLTGLANRRYYDLNVEKAIRAANESKSPLTLVLADIDFFKKLNDKHGHQVGDHVIRVVSKMLLTGVRETDFVARYGGEEFAIIMPWTAREAAVEVSERLRKVVADRVIVNRQTGTSYGSVTLSFGVASYNHGEDSARLFRRADKCLYAAKNKGRNRVVSLDVFL